MPGQAVFPRIESRHPVGWPLFCLKNPLLREIVKVMDFVWYEFIDCVECLTHVQMRSCK